VRAVNGFFAARIAGLLLTLRNDFEGWWIHRSDSGRWLAIRGNTCIRAHNAAELRQLLRRHLDDVAHDLDGGEQA
jgi:hypothetical protein